MGVDLTSNSWGGGGFSQALLRRDRRAPGRRRSPSSRRPGNDGVEQRHSPALPRSYDLPNIIAVAATDHNDQMASFSNWGATSVDLGRAGREHPEHDARATATARCRGTSMATPHVAGRRAR